MGKGGCIVWKEILTHIQGSVEDEKTHRTGAVPMQPSRRFTRNESWKFAWMVYLMSGVLVYGVATGSHAAMKEPGTEHTLSERVVTAALIFSGTVEQLEGMGATVPYTHVTYRIEEAFKGRSAEGETITLRFLGGRTPNGRYLEVSDMPQFQVGDRDLLFVRKETTIDCPLVGCEDGRFRIINQGVHGNDGRPVLDIQNGRFHYGGDAGDQAGVLSFEQVKGAIENEIGRLFTEKDLQFLEPIQSIHPGQVEPPSVQPDEPPPDLLSPHGQGLESPSEAEKLEVEALEKNRGNPVLKDHSAR
jgi:hypothetical protein